MRFCTDLLARVRSRFSAPSARANGRGRSWTPGEFCGLVEPRLYFPSGAATACLILAPRCNGRKAYTVYLLKILQVKCKMGGVCGCEQGVWFVPTFLFEKLATM